MACCLARNSCQGQRLPDGGRDIDETSGLIVGARQRHERASGADLRIVTIFGGTGFLGRHIVQRLAQEGYGIRVATRRPELAGFLRPCGDVGQVVPVQANVRNEESVRRAVAGADAIINLTGILYERGRQNFYAVHVASADRIARAAAEAGGGHLLHVSAIGADVASPSDYARSKAAGENGGQGGVPQRHHLQAEPRVRAGGRLFQPLRVHGASGPGPAAVLRRPAEDEARRAVPHARVRGGHHAVPAGVRRRHRRGRPAGARRRRGARQNLRAWRALGLQLTPN